MAALARVCVFCGSKHGAKTSYTMTARKLGAVLADRGLGLVYGGGDIGLMGEVADSALSEGAEVVGVIPEFMIDHEVAHDGLTELRVVDSMHERKAVMTQLADAFVALPGGWGTLEELFEVITWAQLDLHRKPVGLLNVAGYFDPLIEFIDRAVTDGFIRERHRSLLVDDDDIGRLFDTLATRADDDGGALTDKWS
jgi:hypothetical protein